MAMAGKETGKHRKLHLEKIQVEPEIVPDRFNAPDVAVRHPEGYVCGDLFNILALKGIKSAELQTFRIGILRMNCFDPCSKFP